METKERINNIREKIRIKELYKEAKKVPREELEEVWTDQAFYVDNDDKVDRAWATFGVVFAMIAAVGALVIVAEAISHPGMEVYNVKSMAEEVCQLEGLGKVTTIDITQKEIDIWCAEGDITIRKRFI